jgi:hypothetical protein
VRAFTTTFAGYFIEKVGILSVSSGIRTPLSSNNYTDVTLTGLVETGLPMLEITNDMGVLAGRGELKKKNSAFTTPVGTDI